MKILFLNPPAEFTIAEAPKNTDGKSYVGAEDFGLFPPLGLLYVLSYLEKNSEGHEIFFKDCIAEKYSHSKLEEYIQKIKPDVCGITSFTIAMVDVCMAAKNVRKHVPSCHITLGGHHPIAFPTEAAQLPEFDTVVVGEGEFAFAELIKRLEKKEHYEDILGVYTKNNIQPYLDQDKEQRPKDSRFLNTVTVPAAYIENLDDLPIPNRNYLKNIFYQSVVGLTDKLATILSTRGCPYLCTFCDVPYKKYRARSIKLVVDEVESCMAMGYKEFHFYDDLFNITAKKIIDFCDEIESRKLKFVWDFRGRVNSVTKESLVRAKKAGLRMISFGVETGSNEGLKILKKGTNTEKIQEVFKWCRELGITTIADYIIGFPFEKTEADVRKNIKFLIDLDPDYGQIGILMLLPNTPLFEEGIQKGLIKKNVWSDFAKNPSPNMKINHWTEHLTLDQLVNLQIEGYRKFYFRPKYIIRNALQTRSLYEFSTKVKSALKLIQG